MSGDAYYVPKQTGTYSDVLVAYGLAALIDRIFLTVKGPEGRWSITLQDAGAHYVVLPSEPVQEAWLDRIGFFRTPAFYVRRGDGDKVPPDTDSRSVDATWKSVRNYTEQRRSMQDEGTSQQTLEQQLKDLEPPPDWSVVVFVGDGRMQAAWSGGNEGAYNRIVRQWAEARSVFPQLLRLILDWYRSPSSASDATAERWDLLAKEAGLSGGETASQLLNPHQGKGLNEPKANRVRMDNVKDRPWPEEHLKTIGLWYCMAPRQVQDSRDWKVYVLAPLRLSWQAHQDVFRRFNQYLWREHGQATGLKIDITSLLLFSRAWLDYLDVSWQDEEDFDAAALAPERVVAGFHVAQFKLLSSNAYTMVNLSFLNLPAWSGELGNRVDVQELKEVIDEHLRVIRGIDEGRSDGFNLLQRYRDFVAGGDWDAFFDFTTGYSHEIMRRLNERARRVPFFTTSRLRRLFMTSNKPLLPIIQNTGFQNVAYAIRHSTVIPQMRKARKQEHLYEVRYGLGQDLKRKAAVREEFIMALSDFMHSYNQENAQVLENTRSQMRRDLRTSDIEEVVRLVDEYGSEVVANLLVAYGYAREPREEEPEEDEGQ